MFQEKYWSNSVAGFLPMRFQAYTQKSERKSFRPFRNSRFSVFEELGVRARKN